MHTIIHTYITHYIHIYTLHTNVLTHTHSTRAMVRKLPPPPRDRYFINRTRKRNAARDSMYSKARSPARPAPLPPPAIPKRAPTTTATATNEESIL